MFLISLGEIPRGELLGHTVSMWLALWGTAVCLSKWVCPSTFCQQHVKVLLFLYSCEHLVLLVLWIIAILVVCNGTHGGFNLHYPHMEHLFLCLLFIHIISLVRYLFTSFAYWNYFFVIETYLTHNVTWASGIQSLTIFNWIVYFCVARVIYIFYSQVLFFLYDLK